MKLRNKIIALAAGVALAVGVGVTAPALADTAPQAAPQAAEQLNSTLVVANATGRHNVDKSCATGYKAVVKVQVYNATVYVTGWDIVGNKLSPPAEYKFYPKVPSQWFWTGWYGWGKKWTGFSLYSAGIYNYTVSCAYA